MQPHLFFSKQFSGRVASNSAIKSIIRFTPKVIGNFYETVACDVSNLGRLYFYIKGKV